jgi:hypothetical protein
MRKLTICTAVAALVVVLAAPSPAAAGVPFLPQSVTLDSGTPWTSGGGFTDGDSVTVAPGATISVEFEVTAAIPGTQWRATQWDVSAGPTCVDHDNHNNTTATETFNITAPAVPGTYDLILTAREANDCTDASGAVTLEDAIIVVVEPSLAVDSVTLDGGTAWTSGGGFTDGEAVTVAPGATISVELEVTAAGNANWQCTEWEVDGTSGEDDFTPNHDTDPGFTETETFDITAPAAAGTYDLDLDARSNDGCSGESGPVTLVDAVIVIEEAPELTITKELTSGPDLPDELDLSGAPDGQIDLVVEVGQDITTAYDYTITYVPEDDTDVVVVDTTPAEWVVTQIESEEVDVDQCGESDIAVGGSVVVFKGGKPGKKCQGGTHIWWTPVPTDPVSTLLVDVTTRLNPGHGKRAIEFYSPTSCGPLYLNDGAAVYEADENGAPIMKDEFGDPIPPLFESNALCLAAVEDVDEDGILVRDGTGDEDGDGYTDWQEACQIQTDPCVFNNDYIIDADGIASPGRGIPGSVEITAGGLLTAWPAGLYVEGIDAFDNDTSGTWTFGDDLHLEGGPPGTCPTGIRSASYIVGADCVVLDLNGSLVNGQPVSCDFEGGAFCPAGFLAGPRPKFFDSGLVNGFYDAGALSAGVAEDIIFDGNNNGIFD